MLCCILRAGQSFVRRPRNSTPTSSTPCALKPQCGCLESSFPSESLESSESSDKSMGLSLRFPCSAVSQTLEVRESELRERRWHCRQCVSLVTFIAMKWLSYRSQSAGVVLRPQTQQQHVDSTADACEATHADTLEVPSCKLCASLTCDHVGKVGKWTDADDI